jgi:hypothetical protein
MIDTINKITLHAMIKLHSDELLQYQRVLGHEVNCRGCRWSDKGTPARCRKWDMIAPPEVQSAGCDDWVYDEVPF